MGWINSHYWMKYNRYITYIQSEGKDWNALKADVYISYDIHTSEIDLNDELLVINRNTSKHWFRKINGGLLSFSWYSYSFITRVNLKGEKGMIDDLARFRFPDSKIFGNQLVCNRSDSLYVDKFDYLIFRLIPRSKLLG